MAKHIHWLKIDGRWNLKTEIKAYNHLASYLQQYPNATVTVFLPTDGFMFHKFFRLECDQNYNNLDLECNSLSSGSLIHLDRKPSNTEQSERSFDDYFSHITQLSPA